MQLGIKFKSIAVRWFLNVFLVIAAILSTASIIFSAAYSSFYIERITAVATDYASEFDALSEATPLNFSDTAFQLTDAFEYKTKLEVQVIGADGDIIISTSGFQPSGEKMPDYEKALTSEDGTGLYRGDNSGGESILARTTLIYDSEGDLLGSYRWVTSLKNNDKKITGFIIAVFVFCVGILTFCVLSGLYFIKSIVRPIRDVSNIARKIATGDFEARIEINKSDEIGELCDSINYMASELEQAKSLKNDFISSVSHELRTPLTAIRGWGETAKMSLGTDEELVNRGLDVVLTEADRLSNLVEELLDFSRMEAGRLSLTEQPVNVTLLTHEAVDMYAELARKQGLDLTFAPTVEDVVIMGDQNRLKQVFINIIDNAVKYTESGGQVLVEQTTEEACVRIAVTDTGVGIPAQDIDRIKEKFYKANKTVRGSGIGLAVADEIIKQHQGLLFVESTESVGTTVTVVLPLYEPPAETEEEPAKDENTPNEKEN